MSINIKINDTYTVTSDSRQFILNKVAIRGGKSKEAGETYLKPVGYFHCIDGLTRGLMRRSLKESDAETLEQCKQILVDTGAACLRAFKDGMKPMAFVGFDPGEGMSEEERHRIEKALEESRRHLFVAERALEKQEMCMTAEGHPCRGCPDCGAVMGDATYQEMEQALKGEM